MINYLLELKNRLILLLTTFFSVFFTSYFYKEILLFLFFESELSIDYFIFTDVSEVFLVYIELCFFFSSHATLLASASQIFNFSVYGLFRSEYQYFKMILRNAVTLWLLSLVFSKLFLIPVMFQFFLDFKTFSFLNLHFEARLSQYFIFYKQLYNSLGFYSQILLLGILYFNYFYRKIINIKKYRKISHYSVLIVATFMTPPDLFTQLTLGFLLIIFYELFILWFIIKTYYKKK